MYTVKLNGIKYDVPSQLDDISIKRFIALRNIDINNSPLDVLYWAIDAAPEFKQTDTIEQELTATYALVYPLIDEIFNFFSSDAKQQLPETMAVMGYVLQIKRGLVNDLPYWPFVITKNIIKDENAKAEKNKTNYDPTERIPEILAHYLYSFVTKFKYDEKRAGEFVEVINDLPFVPCIQLGNFFLRRQSASSRSKTQSLIRKLIPITLRRG